MIARLSGVPARRHVDAHRADRQPQGDRLHHEHRCQQIAPRAATQQQYAGQNRQRHDQARSMDWMTKVVVFSSAAALLFRSGGTILPSQASDRKPPTANSSPAIQPRGRRAENC